MRSRPQKGDEIAKKFRFLEKTRWFHNKKTPSGCIFIMALLMDSNVS